MNAGEPTGLFFLDTNVLVYSFDSTAPDKQQLARRLIQTALQTQRGVISTQIVQEFLNVALHKFARPMVTSQAREFLGSVLIPLCQHFPSPSFYDHVLLLKEQSGYSLFDSMVLAAAVKLRCSTLLTEDLQHGRVIQGVQILNPFREG